MESGEHQEVNSFNVIELDNATLGGCVYIKELMESKLTYVGVIVTTALLVLLIYAITIHQFIIETVVGKLIVLLTLPIILLLIYLLIIQARIKKALLLDEGRLNSLAVICDNEERFNAFKELQESINEMNLDSTLIWIREGRVGYCKLSLSTLIALLSGVMTVYLIINGAFASPLLYIFGAVLYLSMRNLIRFLSSYISYKISIAKKSDN